MGIFGFFKRKTSDSSAVEEPREADLIGEVEGFFKKPSAAVIKIKKGPLLLKDRVWIKGASTDLKMTIESMQIDRQNIQRAEKGQSIGLKVKKRCRRGDGVYRIN